MWKRDRERVSAENCDDKKSNDAVDLTRMDTDETVAVAENLADDDDDDDNDDDDDGAPHDSLDGDSSDDDAPPYDDVTPHGDAPDDDDDDDDAPLDGMMFKKQKISHNCLSENELDC